MHNLKAKLSLENMKPDLIYHGDWKKASGAHWAQGGEHILGKMF